MGKLSKSPVTESLFLVIVLSEFKVTESCRVMMKKIMLKCQMTGFNLLIKCQHYIERQSHHFEMLSQHLELSQYFEKVVQYSEKVA